MRRYSKISVTIAFAFLLILALSRASGFLLLPLAVALFLGLGYVTVQLVTGVESPYPRIASGVFERTETTSVHLSAADSCDSCTDEEGSGERRTTYRELVFLGVPLVRLSTTQTILCDVCADPIGSLEDDEFDAIGRELERME